MIGAAILVVAAALLAAALPSRRAHRLTRAPRFGMSE